MDRASLYNHAVEEIHSDTENQFAIFESTLTVNGHVNVQVCKNLYLAVERFVEALRVQREMPAVAMTVEYSGKTYPDGYVEPQPADALITQTLGIYCS